ncbi:MAG TPA: preprotein translocase subunit SecE [Bacilli bacterium]|nr:preprotein translocase subunit SecE [Bacilli bacterium]
MGLKKYTSEVIKEGKRVRWPKRAELFPLILTVLFIVVFAAGVLLVENLAASSMLGALEEVFKNMRG